MSNSFREHLIRARTGAVVPVLLGFLATVPALSVNAATTVAMYDTPLQTRVTAAPNVMFILDDSGSMQGEILPDELIGSVSVWTNGSYSQAWNPAVIGLVYPRAEYTYGSTHNGTTVGQYSNIVADPDNQFGKIARSNYFNSLYYNPAITYSPWLKADGTSFPAASASCAYHNPQNTSAGCRNLTAAGTNENSNLWQRTSKDATCTTNACVADSTTRTYTPAVYYRYKGTNASSAPDWDPANFEQVVVSASGSYTGDGRAARDDAGCSGGTCSGAAEMQNFANWYTYYRSRALSARAGVGRAFALLDGGTAARPALRVGFATINTSGSIVKQIRNFVGTDRANFFDQLYGVTIPALGTPLRRSLEDVGKSYEKDAPWAADPAGTLETKPLTCRQSFSILMTDGYWTNNSGDASSVGNADSGKGYPFEDAWSETLADVAMNYWAKDLRSDLANNVPTTAIDTAKHQHMVTFGVGLGVSGTVNPTEAFSAIGKPSGSIAWPDPTAFQKAKVDDLLHAAVNSRGGYFSAADPKTFGDALSKILSSISERTASGSNVAANSVALREETRLFQASYVAGRWTGELVALKVAEATGVDKTPVWRLSDGIPAAGQRKLFTSNATTGVAFPSATHSAGLSADEIAYISGVQTKEQKNVNGVYRNRDTLLGDIVNSSPAYVRDTNSLYVGANDGFLHAVDASNGKELFAYMPKGVTTASLKEFTQPSYQHKYFVDGPVSVGIRAQMGDKDFLVGSMGRGGKGVFALDVTNPASFGASNVLWDDTGTTDGDMGNVLSKPLVVRLNGSWNDAGVTSNKPTTPEYGVIVANGVNSANNKAALFVYRFGADGKLLAAKGSQSNPVKLVASYTTPSSGSNPDNSGTGANGLASIRGWDNDGDGVLDFVYGGDLQGNVWKFDLDSTNSSDWSIANSGNPMFVARGGDGTAKRQSITGGFSVALDPVTYKPWIFFGTGRYLEVDDISNKDTQSWYGLRDDGVAITGNRSTALQTRNLSVVGTIDSKPVRGFEGYSALTAGKKGWYVDLLTPPSALAEGERMVADPLMLGRALIAASIVPSADPCDVGGRGYLNAIDAFTGSSVSTPFFDIDGDGSFDDDKLTAGGKEVPVGSVDIGVAMPTSPTIVESLVVAGGSLGTTGSVRVSNPVLKTRISWHEVVKD